MNLSKAFYESLDKHVSKLLYSYRSRHNADITEMSAILESLDKNASNQRKRVAVLLGLPMYMPENPSQFLKICEISVCEERRCTVFVWTGNLSRLYPALCPMIPGTDSRFPVTLNMESAVEDGWMHTDSEEELIKGLTVGIITVVDDVMDPIPCDYSDVALIKVIIELVVLRNRGDVQNTFVNVMGLLDVLNIS